MKMNEKKILETIKGFDKKLPHFPDGRIDYSDSQIAPVVNIVVYWNDTILLLKRSEKVNSYKGKWNTLGGYLDEIRPVQEKVFEELREELSIAHPDAEISFGESYEFHDESIGKIWIVCPVLCTFAEKPEIRIDWEHTEYRWIHPEEIERFDAVPRLKEIFQRLGLV